MDAESLVIISRDNTTAGKNISRMSKMKMERFNPRIKQVDSLTTKKKKKKKTYCKSNL